ncbi:phosphoenolpyruvate carboxykinase, partial [candidate division WOR-3 bacterium]|nr:phosphoenolpyruvate carboxykinase [candidate division WOR-3 bacterium]
MDEKTERILKDRLKEDDFQKLEKIENSELHQFIAEYIDICNPESIFVCNDSPEDKDYIRQAAINNGEEIKLDMEGHTVHYDG